MLNVFNEDKFEIFSKEKTGTNFCGLVFFYYHRHIISNFFFLKKNVTIFSEPFLILFSLLKYKMICMIHISERFFNHFVSFDFSKRNPHNTNSDALV